MRSRLRRSVDGPPDHRTQVTASTPAPRRVGGSGRPSAAQSRTEPGRRERTSAILTNPKGVRPYRFPGLARVSRAEVRLLERVRVGFPGPRENEQLGDLVSDRLSELLGKRAAVSLERVHLTTTQALRKIIPTPCFLAQIALAPDAPRGLIKVELALAHAGIDHMLGGIAGQAVTLRPDRD